MIAAVVAVDEQYAIGKNGGMLVSIPDDLKMFRQLTSGHIVIMGRKTLDALPNGPLPNRINVVVTTREEGKLKDKKGSEYYAAGLDQVKTWLACEAQRCGRHVFVIGGGVIYKELLPYCERVYLTKIQKTFAEADTWFPAIDTLPEWRLSSCEDPRHFGEIPYRFCVYDRIDSASFWDSSWEKLDEDRLFQYIRKVDMQPDEIIERLLARRVRTVCDAGCGCGIYTLKLLSNGFTVSGFDVASGAVDIANKLLEKASMTAEMKTASVLSTGYADHQFDAVVSRDVLDHLSKRDCACALQELYRIVRPGGVVLLTLDHLDDEYAQEPHIVNEDGDFVFTEGKWKGMVFHPYTAQEIRQMIPPGAICEITDAEEIMVQLLKP